MSKVKVLHSFDDSGLQQLEISVSEILGTDISGDRPYQEQVKIISDYHKGGIEGAINKFANGYIYHCYKFIREAYWAFYAATEDEELSIHCALEAWRNVDLSIKVPNGTDEAESEMSYWHD